MSQCSIYVSHPACEAAAADRLKQELVAAGYVIATNVHTVPAGLRVTPAIQAAMETASRFLACFSVPPGAPATAYETQELTLAVVRAATLPHDAAWLIPVKLSPCDIPAIAVGDDKLNELAVIDLGEDWTSGMARLLASLPPAPAAIDRNEAALVSSGTSRLDAIVDAARGRHVKLVNVEGSPHDNDGTNTSMTLRVKSLTGDDTVTLANRIVKS